MKLSGNLRTEERAKNYCPFKGFKNALSEKISRNYPKNGRKTNFRNELNQKLAKILHLDINSMWEGMV